MVKPCGYAVKMLACAGDLDDLPAGRCQACVPRLTCTESACFSTASIAHPWTSRHKWGFIITIY